MSAVPSGRLDPLTALDALPRIPVQRGTVADRLGQLPSLTDWTASAARLRPATAPDDVRGRLTDLVTAATLRNLTSGHGQPVILVHTATAPNAVLPALPYEVWEPSLAAIWTATAAIFSAYAPAHGRAPEAPACDLSPQAAANALMGVHRTLLDHVRRRVLADDEPPDSQPTSANSANAPPA